jgi:hypothetical protein
MHRVEYQQDSGCLAGPQRGDHGTPLLGEHGPVSVIRADRGAPTAEQPVQHDRKWPLGILMDLGVIMRTVRALNPENGLFAEEPEHFNLLQGNRHCSCP